MNQLEIEIDGEKYIIKQSFRSYLYYEEMTGKQISDIKSIKDILTLLYCTFKACNKNWKYDFDMFVDAIDEDPTILDKFNQFNAETTEKKI